MVTDNTDNHETAFTVSIDYAGTTTGISAEERGMTARHCISEDATKLAEPRLRRALLYPAELRNHPYLRMQR